MPKRILIAGYYGFQNAGDEAILSVLSGSLRASEPRVEISVISGDPAATAKLYRTRAIPAGDLQAILQAASRSDLILLGGGGIFQDYWGADRETLLAPGQAGLTFYSSLPLLGRLLGIPVVIHAAGVGPLASPAGREMTCRAFEAAQCASVRDEASRDCLLDLGFDARKVPVVPDPGFAVRPNAAAARRLLAELDLPPQVPLVGVCLRHWEIGVDPDAWQAEVAAALDEFVEGRECRLLFVPFQTLEDAPLTDDAGTARKVLARMRNKSQAVLLPGGHPPQILAGVLGRCQLVLGMRYHSLVFAAAGRIPMVGLAYDPKVTQLMGRLGLPQDVLDLAAGNRKALLAKLAGAWERRAKTAAKLAATVPELREAARSGLPATIASLEIGERQEASATELDRIREFALKQTGLLVREEAERRRLAGLLAEQTQTSARLEQERRDQIGRIAQLDRERSRFAEDVQSLTGRIDSMEASRGWKLLLAAWRLRLWIAPHGSPQERLLAGGLRTLRRLARLPRAAWTGLRTRLAGLAHRLAAAPRPFDDRFELPDHSRVTLFTDDPRIFPDYLPRRSLAASPDRVRVRVSLIATVKNEAGNVAGWLSCIQGQTRLPDEIVVVDGGSSDGTARLLSEYAPKCPVPMQVLLEPGANPARARNLAIQRACFPVVAVTDFGCLPEADWLEKLVLPFEVRPETQVSCGFYDPVDRNGRLLRETRIWPGLDEFDPRSFLPSSRSVAFTRKAVLAVGGHPEWLTRTGDDTYLDLALKHLGGSWAFVPEARVRWFAPDTLPEYVRKMHAWAAGDGEAGIHGRYYWRYVLRLLAGTASALLLGAILAWTLFDTIRPASLLAGSATFLGVGLLLVRRARLPARAVCYRALGQAAQVAGFLAGARGREPADARRRRTLKGTVVILSGVPIDDTGGGARGAQWAAEFLRRGYGVVFVHKFPRDESRDLGLRYAHPDLVTASVSGFDPDRLERRHPGLPDGPQRIGLVEFPLEDFLPIIRRLRSGGGAVVYDLLDEWGTALGGSWYSPRVEREVVSASTLLIATTDGLRDRLRTLAGGRDVALLPNAFDAGLFDASTGRPRPPDLPDGDRTLVYVGALWGDWFDWDLLKTLALRYPASSVAVIGDYRGQLADRPPNLAFLGLKPQRDLPAYLAHADACILPWKVDAVTQATSPLKVYEYLAMGRPVVAPRLMPLEGMPGVFLAEDREAFLRRAGEARLSSRDRLRVASFLKQNTWSARVDQLLAMCGSAP